MAVYSYGQVLIKKLKNSSSLEIMYFQHMVLLFASALLLPIGLQDDNFNKPSFSDLFKLSIFTCIPLCLGGLGINQALLMTNNYGLVTPFMFSSIISGYLVSVIRYGEEMNMVSLFGTISIVLGVTFIMRSKEE
jgi:drug/metabolite transporter (DMT)-like permease